MIALSNCLEVESCGMRVKFRTFFLDIERAIVIIAQKQIRTDPMGTEREARCMLQQSHPAA